ncbi:hypothetical protein AO377_1704 [Moraxella catarrhalis]|nr:hypothetical protein AO377_1704 [Moraxella catarrhalis]
MLYDIKCAKRYMILSVPNQHKTKRKITQADDWGDLQCH